MAAWLPGLRPGECAAADAYAKHYHFAITPYTLSLIRRDRRGRPQAGDPVWRQYRPLGANELGGSFHYDGRHENWEIAAEMPTRLLQHKYPGRAIVRLTNACFSQCNFCYLTARVIDRATARARQGGMAEWPATLRYLRAHPEIHDVLISGGDPLLLDNAQLDRVCRDLRAIPSIHTLRLNTRALTTNPFRFDRAFAKLCARHRLTALEIHLAHPCELTADADAALARLDAAGHRPLILWRAPLLHGVNDSVAVLEELLLALYRRRITPYYLFHYAPYTLARAQFGVPLRRGATLLRQLRRRVPGPAFPRYTLFHPAGKHDIPLEPRGNSDFSYTRDRHGHPVVRYRDWRGCRREYPDVTD